MLVRSAVVLAATVGCSAIGLAATVAPAYAVDNLCEGVEVSTPPADTGRASAPYDLLGIAAAADQVIRFAPPAKKPVRVAVLSSGVHAPGGAVPVHQVIDKSGVGGEITDPQGTEVAGLVAGAERTDELPVGIATRAEIVDIRVFFDRDADTARERPGSSTTAAGLSWLAPRARDLNVKVAVVPFTVAKSPALEAAVQAVQKAGVVLVAASGDRPADGSEFSSSFDDPPALDEDAADLFFPASYPHVVAVNATALGDPDSGPATLVKNSLTSVAAPTYDAVSYGLNGHTCVLQETSTGAAAAEVAGVLALLAQRFSTERPAQLIARLENTADGTTDSPTPLTGAGVVQPYEALTRPLAPSTSGAVERTVVRTQTDARESAPEPAADLLASTRDNAVWWGLIGGGLLVIALMLRPVLARRRRV